MVSSNARQDYEVQLTRIICADPNPEGPGILIEEIESSMDGLYPSRLQPFYPGSYIRIDNQHSLQGDGSFVISANIYPTLLNGKPQTILAMGDAVLYIAADGSLSARLGENNVTTGKSLRVNNWYCGVELRYLAESGTLSIQHPPALGNQNTKNLLSASLKIGHYSLAKAAITIGANFNNTDASDFFNGKIESPAIFQGPFNGSLDCFAQWDFSLGISSTRIEDTGPKALHGVLVNLPTRAVTGSNWNADEMCWRHAPDHYGAIHFHEDDIIDFDWQADFFFEIPDGLSPGIYAARLRCGEYEDSLPFFVCAEKGKPTADLCVLVSTFTYAIYGNHARPEFGEDWAKRSSGWNAYPWNPAEFPEYGLSTYNTHSDGSGICHASYRRPLFNMRPGYLTFSYGPGSGLRHFQADSHLIAWLHAKNYAYDIITDQELHDEGVEAISAYKALTTGTHPEYHTAESLDALQDYRDQGGRLMYLGGNGFYWRIAIHEEQPGTLEIRRGEGGIRAWASEPGEYYNAFDGSYGGLWRRSARPPQQLVGIGFSAQGIFFGSYYDRVTGTHTPPSSEWIFAGIEDNKIGDFGLSGGGAAGFELDRVDYRLGSPEQIEIVATSRGHHEKDFVLTPEDLLTHITNWPGEPVDQLLRADMVYFEVPGGGEVFSTGSITFCGSLPHNNFNNNVSALLCNIVDRFLR
jgi:N,N-dimethylformamidase